MLTNRTTPGAREKLCEELRREPGLEPIVGWLDAAPQVVALELERTGLELSPAEADTTSLRRVRVKLFRAREGKERFCAFFFKRSNLPWSPDRFSYGGVEFHPDRVTRDEVLSWLRWLCSGLDPAQRPERLRRAFLYDIPD